MLALADNSPRNQGEGGSFCNSVTVDLLFSWEFCLSKEISVLKKKCYINRGLLVWFDQLLVWRLGEQGNVRFLLGGKLRKEWMEAGCHWGILCWMVHADVFLHLWQWKVLNQSEHWNTECTEPTFRSHLWKRRCQLSIGIIKHDTFERGYGEVAKEWVWT